MKKNKITFTEIKKYLKEKGFILSKKKEVIISKSDNLNVLSRTFISSIIDNFYFLYVPSFCRF